MNIAKKMGKAVTIAALMILTALPVLAQASVKQTQYRYRDGYTYTRTTVTPYGTRVYTQHYYHHRYRHYHRGYTHRDYQGRYYYNGSWRSY